MWFVKFTQCLEVAFLVFVLLLHVFGLVVVILAEETLPELLVYTFIFVGWGFNLLSEQVESRAQISMEIFAANLAADTSSTLIAPITLICGLLAKVLEHIVNIDPFFVLNAEIWVRIDFNAILV